MSLVYYELITQCAQNLKNLELCFDKAEKYAAAKNFDVGVLLTGRLAPDMHLLRHNGVDVGKRDFLGPINFVDA